MSHGLYPNTLPAVALTSAARTDGTVNGTSVDLGVFGNDFREALFVIQSGTITDGTHAFKLQDSPNNSAWTDVDADHVQGAVTLGAADDNVVKTLGYRGGGSARYVRLVVTTSGSTTGGVFGAAAVLADGSVEPVNRS